MIKTLICLVWLKRKGNFDIFVSQRQQRWDVTRNCNCTGFGWNRRLYFNWINRTLVSAFNSPVANESCILPIFFQFSNSSTSFATENVVHYFSALFLNPYWKKIKINNGWKVRSHYFASMNSIIEEKCDTSN